MMQIPFAFARQQEVFLVAGDDGQPMLVCSINAKADAICEVRRHAARVCKLEQLSPEDFQARLQSAYESHQDGARLAMESLGDELNLDELAEQLRSPVDLLESADDAPVIRLINALLAEAIRENASDIHIEPFEGRLLIRLRVDGVLRELMSPPAAVAPPVISRIKVMAKLDIAEKRIPQDGRISLRVANRAVDVRVSTMPSGHGERVVMRLLDKQAGRLALEQIGMDEPTRNEIDSIIHRPHGIFLVTGPTGSGKTTTLYAALGRLNDSSRNIMTVEDPIEYFIEGIAQSQVNTKVDMSFARGLRAILRQDPDVVMVGEIRDLETAQIAIQASLTGHLVLSTLHTNTAVGAITRLRDMGIEPFLLASSLVGVLAQRLVRLLCPQCKSQRAFTDEEQRLLRIPSTHAECFVPSGCAQCNDTGYRGRTAIYELVMMDTDMRTLIHDEAGEAVMESCARKRSDSLLSNGLSRVLAGDTSAAELLRVSQSV